MTLKQNSILVMLRRLLAFLKSYLSLFSGFAAMDDLISKLEVSINKIEALKEKQSADLSGLRTKKEDLRTIASKKALEVSKGLQFFAKMTNDVGLAKTLKYTITYLNKVSDDKLKTILLTIDTTAQNNKTELGNNGISLEKIADTKLAIDAYIVSIDTPKDANIARTQVTDKMAVLFVENSILVGKIDLIMATFRFSNPEFYSEFKAVRKIFSRSYSLAAKVKVSDRITGLGIKGVRILFTIDKEVKVDKLTAAKGSLSIKSLSEGKYNVNLSKIGYITQNLMVNIPNNEFTSLNINLEKELLG